MLLMNNNKCIYTINADQHMDEREREMIEGHKHATI